jgi:hypothetical protein
MGISVWHTILFLMVVSSVFVCLPHAKGGCGSVCVVGGGSSYDFMGDPAVNLDMSSFDEFVRDNLGDNQTTLKAKSLSQDMLFNSTSFLNQTNNGNASQRTSTIRPVIKSLGNTTPDNRTIELGASGIKDKRLSTLALTIFNKNVFWRAAGEGLILNTGRF